MANRDSVSSIVTDASPSDFPSGGAHGFDDREVTREYPSPPKIGLFSHFLDDRCLVLLGPSGAGKTCLFKHFAAQENARLLRTTEMLAYGLPANMAGQTVYVDALDEPRSEHCVRETLGKIIQMLRTAGVTRIRIACRAADWYNGGIAVDVLAEYLGPLQVLMLAPLTAEHVLHILQSCGVDDHADFVREADARGLRDLLGNPQNLIMLQEVVAAGPGWPAGRYALYQSATDNLLVEQNREHLRAPALPSLDRLRDVSGGLCALRLLSDIGGFALAPSDDLHLPYYRDIGLDKEDVLWAALSRRTFVPAGDNLVDSSHRSVAEFLAAKWLAERVDSGLPLCRVRILLGVDGTPATSLRGVHAWLAVMLDMRDACAAAELIAADPSGILVYADGGMLRTGSKQHLLRVLAANAAPATSEYGSLLSTLNLGRLSCGELLPTFKAALNAACSDLHLRTLALDILRLGQPQPQMIDELIAILQTSGDPGRAASLNALLSLEAPPYDRLAEAYARMEVSNLDLTLKATLLSSLYNKCLGVNDLLNLLEQAHQPGTGLNLSKLPHLGIHVAAQDAGPLLDSLVAAWQRRPELANSDSAFRVLCLIDDVLTQVLDSDVECAPARCLAWLRLRFRYAGGGELAALPAALQEAFSAREDVLRQLADHNLRMLAAGTANFTSIMELRALSFGRMTAPLLADRAVALLRSKENHPEIETLYDAALLLTREAGQEAAQHVQFLQQLAVGSPDLEALRARHAATPTALPARKAVSPPSGTPQHINLAKLIMEHGEQIRYGQHPDVLAAVSHFYYAPYGAAGMPRLHQELGEHASEIAAAGLIAYVQRSDVWPLNEVLDLAAHNRLPDSEHAIAAGIELMPEPLPETLLPARLVLVSLLNCNIRGTNRLFNAPTRAQSWQREICRDHPHLAVQVYARWVRLCLERGTSTANGLRLLCCNSDLMPYSSDAARDLLQDFPEAIEEMTDTALPLVLSAVNSEQRRTWLAAMLTRLAAPSNERCCLLWLAVAALVDPDHHHTALAAAAALSPGTVLDALHMLCDTRVLHPLTLNQLDIAPIDALTTLIIDCAPATHLESFLTHSQRLLVMLIDLLASKPEVAAGSLLRRLSAIPTLQALKARIDECVITQHKLAVDSIHQQYSWTSILKRLNGGPPANVEDLQALIMDHMTQIQKELSGASSNVYKWFWNEDRYGRLATPKCENSARDVLMRLLASRLAPLGVDVQPEACMRNSKRADIMLSCQNGNIRLVIELKRDSHPNLRAAITQQLDGYTRLPETQGRGVFGVFWYGETLTTPPQTLCDELRDALTPAMSARIKVFVLNVSADQDADPTLPAR